MQTSEEAFEEILSLSPIDEESELILCCKKASSTFTISETPESVSSLITSCEEPIDRFDILRCKKDDSVTDSFGDEQIQQEYQYEGSKANCCLIRARRVFYWSRNILRINKDLVLKSARSSGNLCGDY